MGKQTNDSIWRQMLDRASEGFCFIDEENKICFANARLCDWLSLPFEKIVGHKLPEFIHGLDTPEEFRRFVNKQNAKTRSQLRLKTGRSSDFWILMSWFEPMDCEFGRGRIAALIDIRAPNRLANRVRDKIATLDAAFAAKSRFIACMSHDLRSPLTAVMGFAELLVQENWESQKERKRALEVIQRNGKLISRLIDDILDMAKVEAGILDFLPCDFSLQSFIEELEVTFERQAKKKDLQLILSVASDLPQIIEGDASRMRQVLNNVIGNALKFTDHGHVEVKVEWFPGPQDSGHDAGNLQFIVTDTGMGIPASKTHCLFKQFGRVNQQQQTHGTSHGLGLFMAQRIAKALGGSIRLVESTPGRGTSFAVIFRVKAKTEKMHEPFKNPTIRDNSPRL